MNIGRSEAIWRQFCKEYAKDNAERLSKKIEVLGLAYPM
jgi:hypothetical protein